MVTWIGNPNLAFGINVSILLSCISVSLTLMNRVAMVILRETLNWNRLSLHSGQWSINHGALRTSIDNEIYPFSKAKDKLRWNQNRLIPVSRRRFIGSQSVLHYGAHAAQACLFLSFSHYGPWRRFDKWQKRITKELAPFWKKCYSHCTQRHSLMIHSMNKDFSSWKKISFHEWRFHFIKKNYTS